MSPRKDLRKLLDTLPETLAYADVISSLSNESDRSGAIVAASIIENMLERSICAVLPERNTDVHARLFRHEGPCGTFAAKIVMARALDIVNAHVETEINLVRAIRNAFAHSILPLTFETPEIAALLKEFISHKVAQQMLDHIKQSKHKSNSRVMFLTMCSFICIMIEFHTQRLGGAPIGHDFTEMFEK